MATNNPCGHDHEGPCVSLGDALFSAALAGNDLVLFAILGSLSAQERSAVGGIGAMIIAAVSAYEDVAAHETEADMQKAIAYATLMSGMLSNPEGAVHLDGMDLNDLLSSLGLSTETTDEPERS